MIFLDYLLNTILLLCIVGILGCFYGLYRNMKVYDFTGFLIENHIELIQDYGGMNKLYDDMLYQFWRPLTIEEWFDEQ